MKPLREVLFPLTDRDRDIRLRSLSEMQKEGVNDREIERQSCWKENADSQRRKTETSRISMSDACEVDDASLSSLLEMVQSLLRQSSQVESRRKEGIQWDGG